MANRKETLKKLAAFSTAMMMASAMIMATPITAFAEDLGSNRGTIELISEGDKLSVNHGEVKTNNGEVTHNENGGTITDNNGEVTYSSGTITDNNGEVTYNFGTITDNNGTVSDNKKGGTITVNNGEVTNNNGTINKNFCTVKDNKGTVVGNYDNATVETGISAQKQYWSVTVTGDEGSIISYEKHSDNEESDFDYVTSTDKYYLQENIESGIINIAPASGKELKEDSSGVELSTTCKYVLTPNQNGNGYILTISSVTGVTSLTLAQLGLIAQAIQASDDPVGPASGGSASGGTVTVVVDNSIRVVSGGNDGQASQSSGSSSNEIPSGAITISLPRTNAPTAAADSRVLGASREAARAISLKMAMLTDAQYKDAVIKNLSATPAGGLFRLETDRIACFDRAMLEAFAKKGNVDMEVLFPLGGTKLSVMIPAGTDINKLLDDRGYSGFLRLLAILGGEIV